MLTWITLGVSCALASLLAFSYVFVYRISKAYPPIGEFIALTEGNLHIVRRGAGAPVVLLHGAGGNLREWTASIFNDVAAEHLAIAIDRPGHGWSERVGLQSYDPRMQAEIIHAALERLRVEHPILVGYSWSGALALAYAMQYPADTGGILFLCGVSHPWQGGVGWQNEIASLPLIGPAFSWTLVPLGFALRAPAAIRNAFFPNTPPPNYAHIVGAALCARPASFLANAQDLTKLKEVLAEMAPGYSKIIVPLIALTGDKDNVISAELHTPPLVEKVAGAKCYVVSNVGHMPHHVVPADVLAAIRKLVTLRRTSRDDAQLHR